MRLVIISDTHELHREADVPHGDLLICAGDFTMFSRSLTAILDFNDWLGELPHRHKLVVPGNHESFLQADANRRSLLANATVLIDEAIDIDGLRIFGSPMAPQLGGAFAEASAKKRERHWARVPDDTNVLVTHGPPYGILDISPGMTERMGDPQLLRRIEELKSLRLHAFGHVHGAHGSIVRKGVMFANVAMMGPAGSLAYPSTKLRIEREKK